MKTLDRARFRSGFLNGFQVAAFLMAIAGTALAADDPSIQGDTRSGIHTAMQTFVSEQEVEDDWMLHDDPVDGRLLRLKLVELHEGIVSKGHFDVSCADFVDESGTAYDLDFPMVPRDGGFRVDQAIVHEAGGVKRRYHVEQRWPGLF